MFLLPDQELERCTRVMQQRVEPYVHSVVAQCAVKAFDNPGEPEPSAQFLAKVRQGQIDFRPFDIPGLWGTTWGTTWFEVSGQIDMVATAGQQVELVVDLGWLPNRGPGFQSEGLVYNADGTAIKSANPRNNWVPLIAADGATTCDIDDEGHFTVYIEAAANPFVEGPTPFSPTQLGEEATGKVEEPYTLRRMDVCVFNSDVFGYLRDLDTVSSLIKELHDDDPRYWQLAKALQRSLNKYNERDLSSLAPARKALAGVLAEPASTTSLNHIAVGHAHIDSAWLWPVRETRRKVARTVSNVLALMDEDPDFTYAMSSAQQYAWLEEEHPDLFKRVQQRVKEGRFIPVGGQWVEADGMLPTGESLIRQMSFGQRYFEEKFGMRAKGVWLPDSFGYTGSYPQIARRAGYEWFLTQKISWNDTTKFPHHSFEWEGIDGSRILTHFPPSDTYCSSVSMHEVMYSQRNFLDKDLSRNAILLYGWGDGGGGPTREMTSSVRRLHSLAGAPKVDFGTPDELFDRVRRDIVADAEGETPVFKGELYLERHRGTLTAQQDMKRGCRQEESMLRVAEYLCAAASIKDSRYVYPREEFDRIWKTLLLNQFHDILPGSAIAWVHRQARAEYARDIEKLRELAQEAGRVIARCGEQDEPVCDSAMIVPFSSEASRAWTVQSAKAAFSAVSEDGKRAAATITHEADSVILDNGVLRVKVEADGTVSSIKTVSSTKDAAAERELVPGNSRLGRYVMLTNEPYHWDAWEIQRDAFLSGTEVVHGTISSVHTDDEGNAVVSVHSEAPGVSIDTEMSLRPGASTLDFTANVDWKTQEKFLKVELPVAVQARNAQYESQYGMVERPIAKNDRSEEAKFESCTHRFVRVADASYATAVVNASTYGSDVSPIGSNPANAQASDARGTMIRLSLLSSPLYPDPHTDQGTHSFAWSLLAGAQMNDVLAMASLINAPKLSDIAQFDPLASITPVKGSLVLDWIKLADDGSGDLIVRLYEAAGGQAQGELHICDEMRDCLVRETDLLEGGDLQADLPRALAGVQPLRAEGAKVHLEPFQLATLRISR